jgi:hypothetical protein
MLRVFLALVLCVGCAHRVRIESDPPGASVKVGDKMVGVTPMELKVRWKPWGEIPVAVNLPGRRTVEIDLAEDLSLLKLSWQVASFQLGKVGGAVPRTVHRAQFVHHHGPAGTWVPDEVK